MEKAKQLETKLECALCGRYGTRGYKRDPQGERGSVVCIAEKPCEARSASSAGHAQEDDK